MTDTGTPETGTHERHKAHAAFTQLVGHTIAAVTAEFIPRDDGEGFYDDVRVRLLTTSGEEFLVTGEYTGYTGNSLDEYNSWPNLTRPVIDADPLDADAGGARR